MSTKMALARPKGYGLSAEIKRKMDEKFDVELAEVAISFICHYVEDFKPFEVNSESFYQQLKDGVALCKLINKIQPGSIRKVNETKTPFKQRENIGNFLDAIDKFGVTKVDSFQTVDLYEKQNIPQVVSTIHALGRKAKSKGFFGIGPKESQQNKREFSEEQLQAGKNVIGLQMGSNAGASQAGQNFGKTRAIID